MHCEQGSSMIVIDSSGSDGDDTFEDPQSSTRAAGVRNADDHDEADDLDEDDDCPTPPRPKKSKGIHAGAALYKCKYNAIWAREFPFITAHAVPGDPYRYVSKLFAMPISFSYVTSSINVSTNMMYKYA